MWTPTPCPGGAVETSCPAAPCHSQKVGWGLGVTRNPPSPTLGTQVGLKMAPWELAGRATRGEGKAEGAENPGGRGRREPRRDKGDRTTEPEIPDHKEVGIGTKRSSETGPRHSTQKPARRLSHSTHTINILCNERTEHTHTHTHRAALADSPPARGILDERGSKAVTQGAGRLSEP